MTHQTLAAVSRDGAGLLLWDCEQGAWSELGSVAAPADAPEPVVARVSGSRELARHLCGVQPGVSVAVAPLAPTGPGDAPASVALDYLELTVRYRRQGEL